MFYSKLKLREQQGLITPKGPNFSWARSFKCQCKDSFVYFKTPKHSPRRSNNEPVYPKTKSKHLAFRNHYNETEIEQGRKNNWNTAQIFYHSWAYYGPWFSGPVAELRMSFTAQEIIHFPETISLFHPRAFEQIVAEFLTDKYGYHLDSTRNNIQEFNAPVDWMPLSHRPVPAVRLKVVSEDFSPFRTIEHWLFFALADDTLATISFNPSRILNLPRAELDKRVNEQPMLDKVNG